MRSEEFKLRLLEVFSSSLLLPLLLLPFIFELLVKLSLEHRREHTVLLQIFRFLHLLLPNTLVVFEILFHPLIETRLVGLCRRVPTLLGRLDLLEHASLIVLDVSDSFLGLELHLLDPFFAIALCEFLLLFLRLESVPPFVCELIGEKFQSLSFFFFLPPPPFLSLSILNPDPLHPLVNTQFLSAIRQLRGLLQRSVACVKCLLPRLIGEGSCFEQSLLFGLLLLLLLPLSLLLFVSDAEAAFLESLVDHIRFVLSRLASGGDRMRDQRRKDSSDCFHLSNLSFDLVSHLLPLRVQLLLHQPLYEVCIHLLKLLFPNLASRSALPSNLLVPIEPFAHCFGELVDLFCHGSDFLVDLPSQLVVLRF
ncbi:hypothetical protein BLNAU_17818 [Blattamonas nauphoetae]|uniref:Uncharacterized protein n=1 Tax=Blattamonas nauphoetae TaxID=2049346 RepID=A0ABQ9X6B9_9EUKA|nr:hypothetical protein BLNAU_17818 [Blattamonas nauphoetae]